MLMFNFSNVIFLKIYLYSLLLKVIKIILKNTSRYKIKISFKNIWESSILDKQAQNKRCSKTMIMFRTSPFWTLEKLDHEAGSWLVVSESTGQSILSSLEDSSLWCGDRSQWSVSWLSSCLRQGLAVYSRIASNTCTLHPLAFSSTTMPG